MASFAWYELKIRSDVGLGSVNPFDPDQTVGAKLGRGSDAFDSFSRTFFPRSLILRKEKIRKWQKKSFMGLCTSQSCPPRRCVIQVCGISHVQKITRVMERSQDVPSQRHEIPQTIWHR